MNLTTSFSSLCSKLGINISLLTEAKLFLMLVNSRLCVKLTKIRPSIFSIQWSYKSKHFFFCLWDRGNNSRCLSTNTASCNINPLAEKSIHWIDTASNSSSKQSYDTTLLFKCECITVAFKKEAEGEKITKWALLPRSSAGSVIPVVRSLSHRSNHK